MASRPPSYESATGIVNPGSSPRRQDSAGGMATTLLEIPNVKISQIYEGETTELGSATLELSMIAADPEPFLIVKCGECEVVLEPEARIYHRGEGLIIPWLEVPGALLLVDLASASREHRETLDTYLVSYTSMPAPEKELRNQLALVDDQGAVVGELDVQPPPQSIAESGSSTGGGKDPVYVDIKPDGKVVVEAFKDSKIVSSADYVSSGIVYAGDFLGKSMLKGSAWLQEHTKAAETDVQFSANTHANVRRIHSYTGHATKVSAKTLGYVASLAERAGGRVLGGSKKASSADAPSTATDAEKQKKKPGVIAQSAYAIHNVWEALDSTGKALLRDASTASSSAIRHKYGSEAGNIATELTGSVRNVALVYFDARGVGRTALLRGTIKGGIKARLSDGSTVVLKGEDQKSKSEKS